MNTVNCWCPTCFQSYPKAFTTLVNESEPKNQAAASNPTASRIPRAVYRRTDRAETPGRSPQSGIADHFTQPRTVIAWSSPIRLDLLAHCQQPLLVNKRTDLQELVDHLLSPLAQRVVPPTDPSLVPVLEGRHGFCGPWLSLRMCPRQTPTQRSPPAGRTTVPGPRNPSPVRGFFLGQRSGGQRIVATRECAPRLGGC